MDPNAMMRFRCLTLAAALFFAGSAFAQTNVSGTVTDADTGEVLPGASVIVEGTAMVAATNKNGRYAIDGNYRVNLTDP